jgi:hypothetical protein
MDTASTQPTPIGTARALSAGGFPKESIRLYLASQSVPPEDIPVLLGLASAPATNVAVAIDLERTIGACARCGTFVTLKSVQHVHGRSVCSTCAALPAVTSRPEFPARRCDCGQTAVCIEAKRISINLIPAGTEMKYRCPSCSRKFIIESKGRTVFTALRATALTVSSVGCLVLGTSGLPAVVVLVFVASALVLWGLFGLHRSNASRFPILR